MEGGGCESREPAFAYRSANTLLRATVVSNLPPPSHSAHRHRFSHRPPFVKTKLPVNKLCVGRGALFSVPILSSRQHIFPRNVIPSCPLAEKFFYIHVREYFSLETRDSFFFFFSKRSRRERDLFLRRTAYFLDLYDYCLNFAGRCGREIREIREKRGWW